MVEAMSGGTACTNRQHRKHLVVLQRECNYSAFNGYRRTPSRYSAVLCTVPTCRLVWRTKAAYVRQLPDATAADRRHLMATGPGTL
jgi:hypothetical protein